MRLELFLFLQTHSLSLFPSTATEHQLKPPFPLVHISCVSYRSSLPNPTLLSVNPVPNYSRYLLLNHSPSLVEKQVGFPQISFLCLFVFPKAQSLNLVLSAVTDHPLLTSLAIDHISFGPHNSSSFILLPLITVSKPLTSAGILYEHIS